MTHTAARVVVVGSINVDQVVRVDRHPRPGETLIGGSLQVLPGGKGANQAVAAALRGARVSMIGAVGDDAHAATALATLTSSGVDVSLVRVVPGPTGLALITVGADGENTIIVVPGANDAVTADVAEQHASLLETAAVVVLQGEIPVSTITAVMLRTSGRVVLNLAPVVAVGAEALRLADPLVVNEHEAGLLLQQVAAGQDVPGDDAGVADALRAWGIASVVVTCGPLGAVIADSTGTHSVAAPTVESIDSSGAGDAFVGALSAELAAGATLVDGVRVAVRVGAFAVRGHGTQPSYPTLDDVLPEVAA
ncbi:ribokinase [Cryobacterium psychrophilum]|uniref:Ribokinase n=1 Tax=Cryobacterium psychrophilum TaxID=41988 RepID=A0A4Y8KQN1_9MICO|nr:ribokinase [Cryobacterium psychrophilum]TDW29121.1 ribokinase [Cryobacterium psychrophilum]TFD79670.1 ribokinase [Cryobacterium psychrophilum]